MSFRQGFIVSALLLPFAAGCSSADGNGYALADDAASPGESADGGLSRGRSSSAGQRGSNQGSPDGEEIPSSGEEGTAGGRDAGKDAKSQPAHFVFPFAPSNLPVDKLDLDKAEDLSIGDCKLDTADDNLYCHLGSTYQFTLVTLPDGTKVRLLAAKSIHIEAKKTLTVTGRYPLILVAATNIDVEGGIDASGSGVRPGPGGFPGATDENDSGKGPGGGGAPTRLGSSAGGSYCGLGGSGTAPNDATTNEPAAAPGHVYGSPELVPLLGGSSGGSGFLASGSGGGAVELVAGSAIDVRLGAWINAGGGGGRPAFINQSSGGGSGGAILVEAPVVRLSGVVAANGGGGGQGREADDGDNGNASAVSANGGMLANKGAFGGNGGAGEQLNGSDGNPSPVKGQTSGAGGGGVGRIRINTTSGQATLTGATISPSPTSPCVTQGKVSSK